MDPSPKEGAVLVACTQNAVRSPMAAAMLRHLTRGRIYIESAGVKAGELDPLAVEVMAEIGLEIGILEWVAERRKAQRKAGFRL